MTIPQAFECPHCGSTTWEGDHDPECSTVYCADCGAIFNAGDEP